MRRLTVTALIAFCCLTASAQTSPRVTYGAAGRVVAASGFDDDTEGCSKDRVAGSVVKVEANGDGLELVLRLPGGSASVFVDAEGMNPSDRQAMISTLLSKGSTVSVQVNVCGNGGIMSADSIRALPPGSPGYPPAPKLVSGGRAFQDLRRFVGKYQNSAVLRNAALRRALAGLGLREFRKLDHFMGVQGPVALEGDDVMIAGCAPHQCLDKSAAVVASTASGEVHAAVKEGGIILLYSRQKTYERLPAGLKNWVAEEVANSLDSGVRLAVRYR
jgi:hypothetical protein